MYQSGGEGVRQHSSDHTKNVVEQDSAKHAREEECRVVVVYIQDSPHGPEGYVMQAPAQEQPGGSHHRVFSFFGYLGRLSYSTLRLKARVAVDNEEDEKEDNVGPPDDRVTK